MAKYTYLLTYLLTYTKNEWLLPSASFTAKFWLVFVLTLEKAVS